MSIPRLPLAAAFEDGSPFSALLAKHGFCILHSLPPLFLEALAEASCACQPLLSQWQQPAQKHPVLAVATPVTNTAEASTRARAKVVASTQIIAAAAAKQGNDLRMAAMHQLAGCKGATLPLDRVGLFNNFGRVQLHLLADRDAMNSIPWSGAQAYLHECLARATSEMHALSTRLVSALDQGGARLEQVRSEQAAESGDVSVLDVLLYGAAELPEDASLVSEDTKCHMRAHTDPGLLTLTLGSDVAGLQVFDLSSRAWVDIEALITPDVEAVVFAGEALQFGTSKHYTASPHRVRRGNPAPRLSTVFELRMQEVVAAAPSPPKRRELTIRSGGQTGADRAALDWAVAHGVTYGGWCPRGHRCEDGCDLESVYPSLCETPSDDYQERTEWNVRDADATVIFSLTQELAGGTLHTQERCVVMHKPYLLLVREDTPIATLAERLVAFVDARDVRDLNIAGPRASQQPDVGAFTTQVLEAAYPSLFVT